jgi:hypothetical protein
MQKLQTLQLKSDPFRGWVSKVIKVCRKKRLNDNQIKNLIKEHALNKGYSEQHINKILRENGIGIYRTRPVIYRRYPKLTFCPKCNKVGRISIFYHNNNKPAYIIIHEKISGVWGKSKKVPRYRRCYIYCKECIKYVGKQLEFYEKRDLLEHSHTFI